jgi:hypothetical protein
MALTYKAIAAINVGVSGVSTLDFSSIPNTYDDLILHLSVRSTGNYSTGAVAMGWSFNGTTSNRTGRRLYAAGGSFSGDTAVVLGIIPGVAAGTQNSYAMNTIYIPDYASSKTKVFMVDAFASGEGGSAYEFDYIGGHWNDTTAINRVTVTCGVDSFIQHSTATLLGIKKS